MKIIFTWVTTALALLVCTWLIPGIKVESIYTAFLVAFVWGLVNVLLKPILFILTLPLTILTFGIFTFILNGLLFWLVAALVPGFQVASFWDALLGTLIVSAISFLTHRLTERV